MLIRVEERKPITPGQGKKPKKVGVFECDQCKEVFEDGVRLHYRLSNEHHFCSKKCYAEAGKVGNIMDIMRRKIFIERFNVENPQQSPEIREKTENTNLERYGFISPGMNIEVQNKAIQTSLERYNT